MNKDESVQSNDQWPDSDQANVLMEVVLQHFVTHHKVVFKKLHVAQEATLKSLDELEEMASSLKGDTHEASLENVRRYDYMWGQIIEMFKSHGATEEDLDRIENILLSIPRAIRKYYDAMIAQDKALKAMIAQLHSEEYQRASAIINKVQSRPNPMTGLGPEEFDDMVPRYDVPSEPSYQFSVDSLKNHD